VDLAEQMVRHGLAVPATRYLAKDPERARRYEAAFSDAKAAHVGAHAGKWLDPAEWRRGARLACERPPRGQTAGGE
jgi:micrococcal nuclease